MSAPFRLDQLLQKVERLPGAAQTAVLLFFSQRFAAVFGVLFLLVIRLIFTCSILLRGVGVPVFVASFILLRLVWLHRVGGAIGHFVGLI